MPVELGVRTMTGATMRAARRPSGSCSEARFWLCAMRFVSRYQLERSVGAYLETLRLGVLGLSSTPRKDPDVLARVLEEFDPSDVQAGGLS